MKQRFKVPTAGLPDLRAAPQTPTTSSRRRPPKEAPLATEFDIGALVGILVGEGHFGGDGRQPQVTLRMHVRHEAIFRWLERVFPGGRLYGPYHHGGREYFQWMARGPFLRDELVPLLRARLGPELDEYSFRRFEQMCARYGARLHLTAGPRRGQDDAPGGRPSPGPEDQRV